MQIIIPMSGFGERFRRVGYKMPKPLIDVDGEPIIGHVIKMFPGETDFIFICNKDHLANPEYKMAETLRRLCPTGKIVPINSHKLGPVNAVLNAQNEIDLNKPTIVNYCDFTCYWDYADFKRFVVETDCAGAIPAYNGFHPHSLGSTFYAYMKHEGMWMTGIQEKQPYTEMPMNEFASSGTYYFKSGALCLEAFKEQVEQDLNIGGEYYASLAYRILLQKRLSIAIYDLQHFMQWGTPGDLQEYLNWSKTFRNLLSHNDAKYRQDGHVMVPMAGLGSRFAKAGIDTPKPLIEVSGRAMVLQAANDLPDAPQYIFVTRKDLPHLEKITQKLRSGFIDTKIVVLDGPTEGQAVTCLEGIKDIETDGTLTIGACDNGMLYDAAKLDALISTRDPDVIVWTVRGHPDGMARPEQFGWVAANKNGKIIKVSVKKSLGNPETDNLITGTFTFKSVKDFERLTHSLIKKNCRVNGEFYVDSLIGEAIEARLDCRIFDVDSYIGWGTPEDLKIFEYWQSCFHKWKEHPYSLEKDGRIPSARLDALNQKYAHISASRPEGIAASPGSPLTRTRSFGLPKTASEVLKFIPVGIGSVIIDFLTYMLLLTFSLPITASKVVAFITGSIFSFWGNRQITFRKSHKGLSGVFMFAGLYLMTLVLNAVVNAGALLLLPEDIGLRFILAFCVATFVSATINFIGMKFLIFNGESLNKHD